MCLDESVIIIWEGVRKGELVFVLYFWSQKLQRSGFFIQVVIIIINDFIVYYNNENYCYRMFMVFLMRNCRYDFLDIYRFCNYEILFILVLFFYK